MKKNLFLFFLTLLMGSALNAQSIGAKRYALYEHFTNASCGPCASQNPVFEAFYEDHLIDARHIEFHTVWPGTDPMNAFNVSGVADMVTYHQVTGVPAMYVNGADIGGPASVSLDQLNVGVSPIRINVSEVDNDGTRTVTVEVQTLAEVPEGTYFMRVGLAERHIHYTSAPGSNGETDFSDVYRAWLDNNVAYTPAAIGESVVFSYEYTMDDSWEAEQIYPMAYIVDSATKEVLNTGTSYDPNVEFLDNSPHYLAEGVAGGNQFDAIVYNRAAGMENVTVRLESDQPADWEASFSIDGNEYSTMATLDAGAGSTDLHLNVLPGATAGVGHYTIALSIGDSEEAQTLSYVIISGVSDLVAVAASADVDIEEPYSSGLASAGNTANGSLSVSELVAAFDAGVLANLNNLYLSIGWTFPAFSDALVTHLASFLDAGGNLLIAGQDIGWDVMSGHDASHGTDLQKAFYTDYLQVAYDDDGAPSANSFTIEEEDAVFGGVDGSSIINVYGGANLYPDHIHNATDNGAIFLRYNDNGGGAVRVETDHYKVVYFGIGMEQIGDTEVADLLVKTSHDWFYEIVGTHDFDQILNGLSLGQNTPNPANDYTLIDIAGAVNQQSHLEVVDLSGKVIYKQEVSVGQKEISVNTSAWSNGLYFYRMSNSDGQTIAKKMMVVK